MAGFDNEVLYCRGERLEESTAQDIMLMQLQSTDVSRINNTGNPEGAVSANPSSFCHDPVSGNVYVKASGTGNTGWIAIPVSGGSGINIIDTDSASVTGSTISLLSSTGTQKAGSTVSFVASSATEINLLLTDSPSLNTFLGASAGFNVIPTPGQSNTSLGYSSLFSLTTGTSNTAIGEGCSNGIVDGSFNTVVGASAGPVGSQAANVGIGYASLGGENFSPTSTGSNNVAIGYQALTVLNNGNNNVGIGFSTLQSINDSLGNTAVGYEALSDMTDGGSYNIAIGINAGALYTGGEDSNILIGSQGIAGDSNTIRIGTAGVGTQKQTSCFISGITGVTVTGTAVLCSTSGQLGTVVSSERYKDNIQEIGPDVSVLNLKPSQFTYKVDLTNTKQYGLIAEDVHKDFPYLCFYNEDGEPESVRYHELPVFLLKEVQRLSERVLELEQTLLG